MIKVIYITLNILMYLCLYLSGRKISRLKDTSWRNVLKASALGIIAFTLNEGLRFGRGIDYNLYAQTFEYGKNYVQKSYDLLFGGIGYVLCDFSNGWAIYVFLISFVLIIGYLAIVKQFPKTAMYSLPIFPILFYSQTENLSRWFFGLSFIMIGFSVLLSKVYSKITLRDYLIFGICSLFGFLIHYGLFIVPIIYLIALSFKKRPILPPLYSVAIFFLLGFFFQTKFMLNFTEYLQYFSFLSERSDRYLENATKWLTGGASVLQLRAFPSIFDTVLYIICVFMGYKLVGVLKDYKYTVIYNIYITSFITLPCALQIEFLNRYNLTLLIYVTIVLGYIVYYVSQFKSLKYVYIIVFLVCYFGKNNLYTWVAYQPPYAQLYIWDANGKKYLDLRSTYYKDMRRHK